MPFLWCGARIASGCMTEWMTTVAEATEVLSESAKTASVHTEKGEPMTDKHAKIILAYAQNNMNARHTGKSLFVTPEDIHYQLKKIHYETGLNPKNFFDLCRLVGIAVSVLGGENGRD